MFLECTCADITMQQWEELMQNSKPINYNKLLKIIKNNIPSLYNELSLQFPNPYADQASETQTHYILVWSAIEYFIRK